MLERRQFWMPSGFSSVRRIPQPLPIPTITAEISKRASSIEAIVSFHPRAASISRPNLPGLGMERQRRPRAQASTAVTESKANRYIVSACAERKISNWRTKSCSRTAMPTILSVSLRRSIGLVRLSGDDRNDRDLRLVQGSALDRLLSDKALRSRLASELAKATWRNNSQMMRSKL